MLVDGSSFEVILNITSKNFLRTALGVRIFFQASQLRNLVGRGWRKVSSES